MPAVLLIIIAFLLGSIPSGYLIGRLKGVDLREHGSGNIGATNARRVLGKKAGVFTLLFDTFKGLAAVWLAKALRGNDPGADVVSAQALAAVAVIGGHCFSPFLKFRGGKGVATAFGSFIVVTPVAALSALAVFAIALWRSGYVSLASIAAACTLPLVTFGTSPERHADPFFLAAVAAGLLVTVRHRSNIARLRLGQEPQRVRKARYNSV